MIRKLTLAILAAGPLLSGCGFQPLYATADGSAAGLRDVALGEVAAPEEIRPLVMRAFERRTSSEPSSANFDLTVSTTEQAQRLAVQIDASVTRYNYRLVGRYTLIERTTGARYSGRVTSIASFNVVNSQYSTLFAEDAAREKAATQLVEDIERDVLLKLSDAKEKASRAKL
ncbi:MAG: hypothetical protein AB7F91_09800 [Parvularculaceae bacterium]|nr:hypothetical protein [Parvularculaceae bacterium]